MWDGKMSGQKAKKRKTEKKESEKQKPTILGTNLKQLRLARNKSQSEVATALGMGAPTFSSWERGRTEPNIEGLKKLASYFGVKVDDLLETGPRILRIGSWYPLIGDPPKFHPLTPGGIYSLIYPLVFDRLFFFDIYEWKFHLGLIDSFSEDEDNLTYTFYLRKDISFHDGTPLRLADVVASYKFHIREYRFYEQFVEDFDDLDKSIEIIEEKYAVRLKLKKWLQKEYLPAPYIVSENCIPEGGEEKEPIWCFNGTGSWLIDEEQQRRMKEHLEQPVLLKGNENHFGKKPSIQHIEVKKFSTRDDLKDSLENSGVDLAYDFALEGSDRYNIENDHSSTSFYLVLKPGFFRQKPIEFRRAIHLAINREELREAIGEKEARILPDNHLHLILREKAPPDAEDHYNVEEARDLWKKTVAANGLGDFTLKIAIRSEDWVKLELLKIVMKQLKEAGIKVERESDPYKADVALIHEIGFHRPHIVYSRLHSSDNPKKLWNCDDPYMDSLLDNIKDMGTYQTLQDYVKSGLLFIPLLSRLVAVTYTKDLDTRASLQGVDTLYGYNMFHWKYRS